MFINNSAAALNSSHSMLVHCSSIIWTARRSTMSVIFTIRTGWVRWRLQSQCGQSSKLTSHAVDRLAGYVKTLYQLLDLSECKLCGSY